MWPVRRRHVDVVPFPPAGQNFLCRPFFWRHTNVNYSTQQSLTFCCWTSCRWRVAVQATTVPQDEVARLTRHKSLLFVSDVLKVVLPRQRNIIGVCRVGSQNVRYQLVVVPVATCNHSEPTRRRVLVVQTQHALDAVPPALCAPLVHMEPSPHGLRTDLVMPWTEDPQSVVGANQRATDIRSVAATTRRPPFCYRTRPFCSTLIVRILPCRKRAPSAVYIPRNVLRNQTQFAPPDILEDLPDLRTCANKPRHLRLPHATLVDDPIDRAFRRDFRKSLF
mmetsp:Transcript_11320/g.25943  ORF Transcript_11320/g.25943 Transcript_11320/m.25943 type:complete len:278 (+) Transcript_11320:206-1039(+)